MLRALVAAAVFFALQATPALQPSETVLHIKVAVADADRKAIPVPRHPLLISDNPPSTVPHRVVTGLDGTVNVPLRPGSYIVESDAPFTFEGKAYEWTQLVEIVAGRDAVLELTDGNAEIGPIAAGTAASDTPADVDVSSLLAEWQDSVVALWTQTTHASAFVVDGDGLMATNRRAVGSATSVEVQLTPEIKVAADVAASNPEKDVAVLRINPALSASIRPAPLGCADAAQATIATGQEIVTIGSPLRESKGPRFGTINRVEPHALVTDLVIPDGSSGGPVFTAAGRVLGLTSLADDDDHRRRGNARIVRIEDVCDVVAAARTKVKNLAPPSEARLPVEPSRPFPADALKEAARRRVGSLNPYQISSTDFEISFITPMMLYGVQYLSEQMSARARGSEQRGIDPDQPLNPLLEFSNWSDYVSDIRPVLLVRVTPRLVEGLWTKVARGAAQTQGVALPPLKRIRAAFSRMRAFCGEAEVTPIHPFKIEQRISDTQTINEGLAVFDPGALGPSCGSVKLVLYSEKEPQKGEARVVDARIVQQIWDDFAPYRAE